MTKLFSSVTRRGVTADHYIENGKYMVWYYKAGDPYKTVGFVQIRGISKPLTEAELKVHIDKLWEEYYKNSSKKKA